MAAHGKYPKKRYRVIGTQRSGRAPSGEGKVYSPTAACVPSKLHPWLLLLHISQNTVWSFSAQSMLPYHEWPFSSPHWTVSLFWNHQNYDLVCCSPRPSTVPGTNDQSVLFQVIPFPENSLCLCSLLAQTSPVVVCPITALLWIPPLLFIRGQGMPYSSLHAFYL